MAASNTSSMCRLIRALRLKHGYTQETLAERAGLDYKYYQRLELGQTEAPLVSTLDRLGRVLGVKAWMLLCDDMEIIAKKTGIRASALRTHTKRKPGRPKKVSS
ncbi:MAG TPA: helix-turn-helix domain-containing protein [Opitutaceae bacterium]|jgi:transcriptional regulator with XRE-family HTH domain|nr:helix-turn-helix domain-containing protein [Opitutaceae bacterium]